VPHQPSPPLKSDTFTLDSRDDTDDIVKAFEPYNGKTVAPANPVENSFLPRNPLGASDDRMRMGSPTDRSARSKRLAVWAPGGRRCWRHRRQRRRVRATESALVFVDGCAEDIATDDLAVPGCRGRQTGEWLVKLKSAVRPLLADGAHEPIGESVRPRRCDRGSYGLDADGGKHAVGARGELGVAIADEETEVAPDVF
jgi:hypothetical protein